MQLRIQRQERFLTDSFMTDYDNRRKEVDSQLVAAAENSGFFTIVDHGISVEEIEAMFALSKSFFDLPEEVKAKNAYSVATNNGWEYKVFHSISPDAPGKSVPHKENAAGASPGQYWPSRPEGVVVDAPPGLLAE